MSLPMASINNSIGSPNGIGAVTPSQGDRTVARGSSPQRPAQSLDAAQRSAESLVGQTIGKYAVEKWLGGGGMGQVYLARHTWLDLLVAIKLMNPLFHDDLEAVNRFRREARMAASLQHPNIVRCTDGGAIKNSLYLVTEFLDGKDLNGYIATNGPLNYEAAAWVIMEAAKGLQHAHSKGMIHRDVKPSNLMLLQDGNVKLLDLGIARYINSLSNLTATGQFMGTVDYVAPEQAVDTRGVDYRADIYSLGCTFYHLLTGRAPFTGDAYDSVVSKILAHTEEEPPAVTRFAHDVPKPLQLTLQKMMAKSVEDRFQSAADVVQSLEKFAKPVCGNRRVAKSSQWNTASAGSEIASFFLKALLVIGRTILSIIGMIERVESKSNSRIGGKKQFHWQFSPKGMVSLVFILFLAYTFFFSGMISFVRVPFPTSNGMSPAQRSISFP